MDFGLSAEQELLQNTAREFLSQECPPGLVRELYDDPKGVFARTPHRKTARAGLDRSAHPRSPRRPGDSGMLDMAVLLEEIGRAVVPGPFVFSSGADHAGPGPGRQFGPAGDLAAASGCGPRRLARWPCLRPTTVSTPGACGSKPKKNQTRLCAVRHQAVCPICGGC